MPENPYRKGHLHEHRVRSTPGPSIRDMAERDEIAAVRAEHPDWTLCAAGCGWPVNPAALEGGYSTHPMCEGPTP